MARGRARFGRPTAREDRVSGVGVRAPPDPLLPPRDFSGISGIPEIPKFRRISKNFAISGRAQSREKTSVLNQEEISREVITREISREISREKLGPAPGRPQLFPGK